MLALREQAQIFAGALGESAVTRRPPTIPGWSPDIARPLLRRLTEPTPDAQAKLYAPDGTVIADSRVRDGPGGAVSTEPLPPPVDRGRLLGMIGWLYDSIAGDCCRTRRRPRVGDRRRASAPPASTGSPT